MSEGTTKIDYMLYPYNKERCAICGHGSSSYHRLAFTKAQSGRPDCLQFECSKCDAKYFMQTVDDRPRILQSILNPYVAMIAIVLSIFEFLMLILT